MRFSTIFVGIVPLLLMIFVATCTREAYLPPSVGDVEPTLSSDGQGPQVTTVDSLGFPMDDGPGGIDFFNPDSTRDDDTPPSTIPRPEIVLENLGDAYRNRDVDLFGRCLTSNFRYYCANSTSAILPSPTEAFRDREQELAIHRNMFSPDFNPRTPFRGLDLITVSFTVLHREPYGEPQGSGWRLYCRGVWNLWNTQMAPKPLGIRHEGRFSLDVKPDSLRNEQWLIETWREEPGETHFFYSP